MIDLGASLIRELQNRHAMDALKAVAIYAAWQIFREDELGSIEPDKLADLVVLDKNPLMYPELIKDIHVEQTFVGGVSIYQSKL